MLPKLRHKKHLCRFYLDAIFMLNNLISNPQRYTTPKAYLPSFPVGKTVQHGYQI